ncbi:MAG TPA: radical SAM protein [Bryobacteraceae bacterium]|nr:radical SAM protein [Bryobacteraceae bacterium]
MLKPVLLTHANHVRSDAKQTARMQPYPPLQTILAAAMLRSNGVAVRFFDSALEESLAGLRRNFERMLDRERPRLVVVCDDDFNFLTKMCLLHNRELSLWFAERARAAGIPAIVHGSDSADHALLYLEAGFSAVIRGEVEDALLDYACGHAPETIPGVICRSANGSVHFGPPRIPRSDLDSLPLPAWDLVDIERYREAWTEAHGYFSVNMASSRGCPFRCNWCAKPIYGNGYHARAPRAVAAEMAFLHDHYHPDHIWFADDIFALSGRWTSEFADEVCRLGASVPFKMQSRCDLMTPEAAAALNRAGCAEVWMGAESGSQKILDAMEKGITLADIYSARQNLGREGIRACFFLQFGYPGEGWDEIEETIRMVRETAPDDVGISVSYPLPNTRFHQIVAAQLSSRSNWKDSGDLRMMYRGSWSTEFYRELANAIHAEVRGTPQPRWERVHGLRNSARLAEVA